MMLYRCLPTLAARSAQLPFPFAAIPPCILHWWLRRGVEDSRGESLLRMSTKLLLCAELLQSGRQCPPRHTVAAALIDG